MSVSSRSVSTLYRYIHIDRSDPVITYSEPAQSFLFSLSMQMFLLLKPNCASDSGDDRQNKISMNCCLMQNRLQAHTTNSKLQSDGRGEEVFFFFLLWNKNKSNYTCIVIRVACVCARLTNWIKSH